jgi:aminoglycoside 3-N-acetyltransferase I
VTFEMRRLEADDGDRMRQLNALFATEFGDDGSYSSAPPDDTYLRRVLSSEHLIVLIAIAGGEVMGGLVAYLLDKLEQERSEIYIYDLAVASSWRRRGVATALFGELQAIAARVGAWVIYVQADYGDDAAIALYEKLGTREDVMHFDIPPRSTR